MQGLVHYSDDSSPEPSSAAGPSRLRNESSAGPSRGTTKVKPRSGIVLTPTTTRPTKRPRRTPPISSSSSSTKSTHLPENLTHTAQSDLAESELATSVQADTNSSSKFGAVFDGLTEDEVFKIVTMPRELEGVDDWGIPPEVDPEEASPQLKAKVENFLRLKYERGEHINTRLLSSSSFANPHIYSKLVEFVSIDERATAFPSSGWLTRRRLESLIPTYGPSALSASQKVKEEAVRAAQAIGTRKEIGFAPARHRDEKRREREKERGRDDRREKNGTSWDRKRERDRR